MLSPIVVKVMKMLPESLLVKFTKIAVNRYLKKYGSFDVQGLENIEKVKGAKIFISNHLSNADGLVIDMLLRKKYDPTFIAGAKLSDDPVTNLGTRLVKNIQIKPNTADKDAITNMVKLIKSGQNMVMFPEGTRSRGKSMIEAKKGILLISRLTKAPIVPIALWGTEKLLPINEGGTMADETWKHADVHVRIGEPITLPVKPADEDKKEFEKKSMDYVMKSIANLLPEEYRGVYTNSKE
ncbi:1-acyl-sn-glycerol-3-phosphate acyltransferase [Clostridium gasigenes]|uniref:lysophospholipid acyltransferase family protein n=1 Tax=Clostridium gasigenes TaxID=94869 RepID=UPI001C0A9444|nr:lysophospholipid acyltransferase family protein [Clostridium gasigenes]MBU3137421.1 1-acyl-sn-glycerol-3-phosphate acyltransferase [Clostridium gasigenes]